MSTLEIRDLYASVETKEGRKQILRGVNLTVNSGETPCGSWTERFGKVDAGLHSGRPPEIRGGFG